MRKRSHKECEDFSESAAPAAETVEEEEED